jgi:hypothetical protein
MNHREIVEYVTKKARLVELVYRAPFTMAKVRCRWKGRRIIGYGFAKQTHYAKRADVWNPEMGQRIAEGQAIHDLATTIEELGLAGPTPESTGSKS